VEPKVDAIDGCRGEVNGKKKGREGNPRQLEQKILGTGKSQEGRGEKSHIRSFSEGGKKDPSFDAGRRTHIDCGLSKEPKSWWAGSAALAAGEEKKKKRDRGGGRGEIGLREKRSRKLHWRAGTC